MRQPPIHAPSTVSETVRKIIALLDRLGEADRQRALRSVVALYASHDERVDGTA